MAKVTWLGAEGDPDENTWRGITFKKGESVDVKDPYVIDRASRNVFFKVEGYEKPEKVPEASLLLSPEQQHAELPVPPPSQMPAPQYPVPKPGEPYELTTGDNKFGASGPQVPPEPPPEGGVTEGQAANRGFGSRIGDLKAPDKPKPRF